MDLRKLKKFIDLVEESGITELEITDGEEKVRIVKQATVAPQNAYLLPESRPAVLPTAGSDPLVKIKSAAKVVKLGAKAEPGKAE